LNADFLGGPFLSEGHSAEALFWCAHHEMIHAGQVALRRRLLGQPPLWPAVLRMCLSDLAGKCLLVAHDIAAIPTSLRTPGPASP